jgi:hypothetical protein
LKTTEYFLRCVLVERPYLTHELCQRAIDKPLKRDIQSDGRIRHWIFVNETQKYLRVVTLPDGETVHTAFFDRGFKENRSP